MDLILLTIGYPHPKRDVFVGNEIDILAKFFNKIYIVPIWPGRVLPKKLKNLKKYIQNPKIEVTDIEFGLKDILLLKPKLLKIIVNETFKAVFSLKPFSYKLLSLWMLFRWTFITNVTLTNLERFINKYNINVQDTILYSYWFHFLALSVALCDKPFALKVSRAHRGDLYEESYPQPCKKFILKNIDKVFACSKMGADYINKRYQTDKAEVSYLGTFNRYSVNIDKKRDEIFKIVSCARLAPVKRIDKIVDSLEKIDSVKISWTHIGDGELFEKIRSYAQEKLGKKSNIQFKFLGFMKNDDILNLYAKENFNLFVNTSQSEGLPVSIMEAMSYGIPVVATDVGGTKEIVKNGKNGFLLDKDFSEFELANLIERFATMSEEDYKRFCYGARETWEENFNAKKCYEDFAKRLLALVASKK
ncbi:glycosyl transferase group 1 [Caldicellulosiruptor kronotskyensis 2002]|uniref:Glycosyl transferase group 1 n=1 Tax=Caldicellulosiruptor kronotskyensis (strain DSM 18902 / VKM B-2412 / 2002) TaxID=632348 RepID=E4SHA4_CALK2|nr:glycosyltransferase [Caldicellulosiruptor kronotskyensis]ADQ47129.1 glycosyl transferase group 1 [Caldicellulosiruptor kronotskyensis 2002]